MTSPETVTSPTKGGPGGIPPGIPKARAKPFLFSCLSLGCHVLTSEVMRL